MRVLVTCPPMLGMIDEFIPFAAAKGLELIPAKVTQVLGEAELIELLPAFDGWIIGDDPATRKVFEAGKAGRLKAVVKWGVGIDNVDRAACSDLGIPVDNTPRMFGPEVADVALAYVIGLARQLFFIDRQIRSDGSWPKPAGASLSGKRAGVIGFGDIGRNLAHRLIACGMRVTIYDPAISRAPDGEDLELAVWPAQVGELDFLAFTCSLNAANRHMLNADVLNLCKPGVYVVNVARGPLIDEVALIAALHSGTVAAAALDVFEEEPLPTDSPLRQMPRCIFGSHNGSNTRDAVARASYEAIDKLHAFLSST